MIKGCGLFFPLIGLSRGSDRGSVKFSVGDRALALTIIVNRVGGPNRFFALAPAGPILRR